MQKALQRAQEYRVLGDAALAAAAGASLAHARTAQETAAAKWIELAEREERRAATSRALIEAAS